MKAKARKKKTGKLVWLGIALILVGLILYFVTSRCHVVLIVDGVRSEVDTRRITVGAILKEAGVSYSVQDRIFPYTNYWMTEDQVIRVDHRAQITLVHEDGREPVVFDSFAHLSGNILLDAGIQLFPGDQLCFQEVPIQPDFVLFGSAPKKLTLRTALPFLLTTDDAPVPVEAFGNGETVGEVLRSAGVSISHSSLVFPAEDAAFEPGMSIQVATMRQLTVASNGRTTEIVSGGANVGEALARAAIPLQGSNVSIPAADQALPADGRILIVPVRDEFEMTAVAKSGGVDWSANDTLGLDETKLISEGSDGLTGTRTRVRYENGYEVLREVTDEQTLIEPVRERREYGTKVKIRTLDTADGIIEYWRSVPVYATSYSPCRSGVSGCINGTSSGAKVEKGVIGVTSAWYKLMQGQSVYVPDYGRAIIGDVGGGISGKKWIDLAYSDADFVSWSSNTTLYFLTPVPAEIPFILP